MVVQTLLIHATFVIDKIMVGRLGADAIAAVGLASRILTFLVLVFTSVAGGAAILTAHAFGAAKEKELREIVATALLVSVVAGGCITGVLWFGAGGIMKLMGAEEAVAILGTRFLSITAFCAVAFVLNNMNVSFLRSMGDAVSPLFVGIGMATLGTAMNFPLIFGVDVAIPGTTEHLVLPALGTNGAAVSLLVTSTIGMTLFMALVARRLRIAPADFLAPSLYWLRRTFSLGAPITADVIAWQVGQLGFTRIIAGLGTAALASREILDVFVTTSFILVTGIRSATFALVGQNLGRRDYRHAESIAVDGLKLSFVSVTACIVVLFAAQNLVIGCFNIPAWNREVVQSLVALFCVLYPFTMPNAVFPVVLQSGGDTVAVMLNTSLTLVLLGFPLSWLFGHTLGYGMVGAYLGYTIHDLVKACIFTLRFRRGRWKKSLV